LLGSSILIRRKKIQIIKKKIKKRKNKNLVKGSLHLKIGIEIVIKDRDKK
jgi:hypothetical protein